MNPATNLPRRLATAERRLGRALDALLEARNNLDRQEWFFAEVNLRALFRATSALSRSRRATLRELRAAKRKASQ